MDKEQSRVEDHDYNTIRISKELFVISSSLSEQQLSVIAKKSIASEKIMSWIAKKFVLNIFITSCLSNVKCENTKFEGLKRHTPGSKYLAEFINLANWNQLTPHHNLVRRQTMDEGTFTAEDIAFCTAQLQDISCSTGIIQGFIDADLICGRDGGFQLNACARNERGQYCLSALSLFDLRRNDIIGNCSLIDTSSACPTACRTQLEQFSSSLGCCINAYVNSSINYDYHRIVDYRLWNLCHVPLPTQRCGNSPIISLPINVQECTEEEYFTKQYTQNVCLPQRGQPYINAIVLNSRCNQSYFPMLAEYLVGVCSADANGSPCGLTISETDAIDDLNSDCATSNVSCTLNCTKSINKARDMYSCCLNSGWFNTSTASPPGLSYSVWKSCGIETPGVCKSSLSLRGTAMSIMGKNHITILIMTVTIVGLMCHYMLDNVI